MTSSNAARSLDKTRSKDVHPEPGRPRTSNWILRQAKALHRVKKPHVPFHPAELVHWFHWGLSINPISYNHEYGVKQVIRTLFGCLFRWNKFSKRRGSAADNNVLPNAASGAVTRILKSRNVTVNRFWMPSGCLSMSVDETPADGVLSIVAIQSIPCPNPETRSSCRTTTSTTTNSRTDYLRSR